MSNQQFIKTVQVYHDLTAYIPTNSRQKIVFTNGCFDILHAGHVKNLEAAKSHGDILIVGLNSDASVKMLKGPKRPINSWKDRATVLSSLRCVDVLIGFEEQTPINLIRHIRPDVICKGGDYKPSEMIGSEYVASYGGSVLILPYHKGYSTTEIIQEMSQK